jgi:hypothetical protein
MEDVLGGILFLAVNIAFYYGFFYLICYRYFLRPILHSMGWKGKAPKPTHHLQGSENFGFPIVGESFYQKNIAKIAGAKKPNGVEVKTKAVVFLDPFNRHDNQSVRIEMEGFIVGHLSKENAQKYRAWLKQNNLSKATCQADAIITGGWLRDDSEGYYSVSLDFVMSKLPYLIRYPTA